ncbi:hypothetical protein CI109_103103 [Kwoniella shandongensis]|uniref:Uncharacterized protein n=1 Tax=Kwoniella shandongensis TaxID=1734106 RepID=A0A5M6C8W1_9TREE|nr:uncharacterized protein CI109_000294 [Kwoniella shandongensis]KAA5531453.1 hypothetical protein CI109_000294 [Kwoniella shandongensis]
MHFSTSALALLLATLPSAFGQPATHPRRSRHGQYARDDVPIDKIVTGVNAIQSGVGVARDLAVQGATNVVGQALVADPTDVVTTTTTTTTETVYVTQTVTQGVVAPTGSASPAPSPLTSSSSAFVQALSSSSNPIDTFVSSASSDGVAPSDINGPVSLTSSAPAGSDLGSITTKSTSTGGIASAPTTVSSSAPQSTGSTSSSSSSKSKLVFAHFMVGIVSTYVESDWANDMNLAKSKGIDGFALNIGTDSYSEAQLDLAYSAAASVNGGFDLFISFDFNWYQISDVSGVAQMLKKYVNKPNQLRVDGKPFVSSFIGDGFDWSAAAQQVGEPLYAVPFFQPAGDVANNAGLSGLFSWAAWPGQLDNVPVNASMSDSRDLEYLAVTQPAGKTYMAPVSTWFSTHFGQEVSYSKNWVFKSETLWKDRWEQILSLGDKLDFLEIVTWNDYGESHYIGPYDTPHTDDGSSKWAKDLDHTAMLDFAVPYIKAFKAGSPTPIIDQDTLTYWYRPHLKSAQCDGTDICGSKPTGNEYVSDTIFVAVMTKSGGTVTVTSGSNAPVTQDVAAGVQMVEVPMGVGKQQFELKSTGGGSGSGSSTVDISSDCWNGIYNFNFHSGTVTVQ